MSTKIRNSFISIVIVLRTGEDMNALPRLLVLLYECVSANFSDYEFILVNNMLGYPPGDKIESCPADVRKHVHLLQLSSQVGQNNAILAGLDRSNGDYTIIFEIELGERCRLIPELFDKTQEGYDIVYLRTTGMVHKSGFRFFRRLFYFIMHRYSGLRLDESALDTRIISRRALNSLLRLRENLRYMKAIYSIVGYRTASIEIKAPPVFYHQSSFGEQFRTSLVAITSFTTFLRTVSLWIFLFSCLLTALVIFNAIKVKITNVDIFGTHHETLSGWAFLVVIIAGFFSITFLNFYILSVYLSNIYHEIKHRPLYIIESIQRF